MKNSRTICILELGCKRLRAVIFWRICFFFSLRRCGTSDYATRAAKPTCFEKARGVSARVIRERFSTESVTQWSGQTSGIRERINFGRPGEISKKNLRNNCCPANKQKKIEMFIEICKRMKKEGKENPRIFEPEVYSSSCILLLHRKKLYAFNPLHPNISMHILHTVLHTFPKRLTWRICLTVKSCLSWWSPLLFS